MHPLKQIQNIIDSEKEKCEVDPIYFINTYCFIRNPMRGEILMETYPFQDKVSEVIDKNKFVVINKARQLGISTLSALLSLHKVLFSKNKKIGWITNRQVVTENILHKIMYAYHRLPDFLKDINPVLKENKKFLEFRNYCTIEPITYISGDPKFTDVYCDEAAWVDNIDILMSDIIPALKKNDGNLLIVSSTNGFGNYFHKTYRDAQHMLNDFISIELPWNVMPGRDEYWLKRNSEGLTQDEIDAEYKCIFVDKYKK